MNLSEASKERDMVTLAIPKTLRDEKVKAMYVLKKNGSSLSQELVKIIKKNAEEFNMQ